MPTCWAGVEITTHVGDLYRANLPRDVTPAYATFAREAGCLGPTDQIYT